MMNWFEKIEAYLSNELSEEERIGFEEALKNNKNLYEEFNIYQSIESEMRSREKYGNEEETLKESLRKLNDIYFLDKQGKGISNQEITFSPPPANKSKKIKKTVALKWLVMAAFIASVIMVTTKIYQGKVGTKGIKHFALDQKRRDTLYAQNFIPDRLPEQKAVPLITAYTLYENADYNAAYHAFKNVDYSVVTRGDDDSALTSSYASYYKAQCLLALGNAANAIAELEKLLNNNNTDIPENNIKWYLALAYLKTGRIKEVRRNLSDVAADKTSIAYKERAVTLLKQLNN